MKQLPELTFVVSLGPGATPPAMQVCGAGTLFEYGPEPGTTACFPSACAHSSTSAISNEMSYKMTFFVVFAGRSTAEKRYKERGRSTTGSRLSSEAPPGPNATTASNRAAGPSDATQGLDANVASQHVALPSATADTA